MLPGHHVYRHRWSGSAVATVETQGVFIIDAPDQAKRACVCVCLCCLQDMSQKRTLAAGEQGRRSQPAPKKPQVPVRMDM